MKIVVRIKLATHNAESIAQFERSIGSALTIIEGYAMTGTVDYLLVVSAKDVPEYESTHRRILSSLPGVSSIKADIAVRQISSSFKLD